MYISYYTINMLIHFHLNKTLPSPSKEYLDPPLTLHLTKLLSLMLILLISYYNMTSFFRFVDKRAIYKWYNLIRTCAGECD